MALFSKALRSALSTYRKRKATSLDGSVADMHPSSPKGHYVSPVDGMLGAGGMSAQHSFYDSHAHYRWPDREYEQDPSWSDVMPRATTPRLRLGPVPRPARAPRMSYVPLAEWLKQRQRRMHVRWVAVRHIDPADWRTRCAMAETLLERCRQWLPPEMQSCPPEQLADDVCESILSDLSTNGPLRPPSDRRLSVGLRTGGS